MDRDVSDFINLKDKHKFTGLMTTLASLTGQELIYDNLAKEVGVSKKQFNHGLAYASPETSFFF